jgi:outer membrane protein TolC
MQLQRLTSRKTAAASLLAVLLTGACASSRRLDAEARFDAWPTPAPASIPGSPPTVAANAETNANPEDGPASGSLAAWLALARASHPSLAARHQRWRQAVLDLARARRWPEPEVAYTAFIGTGMMPVTMQRHQLVLRQDVPWPTRFDHAEDAAVHLAESEEMQLFAAVRAVERDVTEQWLALWSAREAIPLAVARRELAADLIEAANGRLAANRGTVADVQMAELALARADDAAATAQRNAELAAVRLKQAAGRMDLQACPVLGDPTDLHTHLTADALVRQSTDALAKHPRLRAIAARAASMDASARAEATEAMPMFGFEAGFMEMSPGHEPGLGTGADIVMLTLMVRIPLWQDSYARAADAMRAGAAAERHEGRMLEQELQAALATGLIEIRDAERRLALYRDQLVPRTQDALQAMIAAWTGGMGTLGDIMRLQQELFELQLMALEATTDAAMARARLAELVGPQHEPSAEGAAP